VNDIPNTEGEYRALMKSIYEETFDRYRVDWAELRKRCELAEAKATAAQLTADAVLATLRALGNRGTEK